MARDFLKINTTDTNATHANLLIETKDVVRRAFELLTRVKSIMDHNHDGSNFSDIETLFGIPATKGQIVYDLVNGAVGAMQNVFQNDDCKQLTEQIG